MRHLLKRLLFLLPFPLFAVSITIINDSPYELKAEIYDESKTFIGSATIAPNGHTYSWQDSYHDASDWSNGPFTIQFFCPNGDEYGKITHVSDGVTVSARGAIGARRCSK